ncbi:MAG: hypothetical protein WD073_09030 [Xanthobacteraceae bacterium]
MNAAAEESDHDLAQPRAPEKKEKQRAEENDHLPDGRGRLEIRLVAGRY